MPVFTCLVLVAIIEEPVGIDRAMEAPVIGMDQGSASAAPPVPDPKRRRQEAGTSLAAACDRGNPLDGSVEAPEDCDPMDGHKVEGKGEEAIGAVTGLGTVHTSFDLRSSSGLDR